MGWCQRVTPLQESPFLIPQRLFKRTNPSSVLLIWNELDLVIRPRMVSTWHQTRTAGEAVGSEFLLLHFSYKFNTSKPVVILDTCLRFCDRRKVPHLFSCSVWSSCISHHALHSALTSTFVHSYIRPFSSYLRALFVFVWLFISTSTRGQ